MLQILLGVSLAGILLSIPLVLVWTRSITRPITRLRDTMQDIRGGALGVQVAISNRDEIGDLAASFNQMSGIIKQHNDQLEAKVKSRTQSLEQQAIELKQANEKAELANQAKSDALRQLEAQKASLEDQVRERTSSLQVVHENLKQALQQEKAAQIYKDQFLANMSHEIRTPLNGVVGFASLLRDDDLDSETREEFISTIESCSNQLLNLINDIVDVAKIEAGEIKLQAQHFKLAQLMRDTANTLQTIRAAKSKEHIHLRICIPAGAEDLEIYTDPLRLQQILINLLGNALKFTEAGTIEFGYQIQDQAVEFFVKDEGIGIAPERMELIYQRFEHLEGTTQKYEGTRLGLSISRGLAELLGATLSAESELGAGSVFRLKLPLRDQTLTLKAGESPSPEPKLPGAKSSK